jgi:hypothetical protein
MIFIEMLIVFAFPFLLTMGSKTDQIKSITFDLHNLSVSDKILQQEDKDPDLTLWVQQAIINAFIDNPFQNGVA